MACGAAVGTSYSQPGGLAGDGVSAWAAGGSVTANHAPASRAFVARSGAGRFDPGSGSPLAIRCWSSNPQRARTSWARSFGSSFGLFRESRVRAICSLSKASLKSGEATCSFGGSNGGGAWAASLRACAAFAWYSLAFSFVKKPILGSAGGSSTSGMLQGSQLVWGLSSTVECIRISTGQKVLASGEWFGMVMTCT